jgi:Mg-chelatase subunit ChlD
MRQQISGHSDEKIHERYTHLDMQSKERALAKLRAAAPDPGSNGVVVTPTNFIVSHHNVRAVLVLDESCSMNLESPSRMQRLKVAAGDFIATAQNGTELGLQSFASDAETASGRATVPIAALGANRSAWTNAVNGLTPSTRTNIGAGLQKAKDIARWYQSLRHSPNSNRLC